MSEEKLEKIEIPSKIVVKDLAEKMNKPVTDVIGHLMQSGVMSSLNEMIDFDTAAIVSADLGFEAILKEEEGASGQDIEDILKSDSKKNLQSRPPVVVVMGHVDHGKTKLLDSIRETNVMDKEAGNITQHIGAYQVIEKNRKITFIDTPGHEAFTAMRSRGAQVADLAILIVAANDGVKPQTIEAIKIIKDSNLPLIVAINKIDLPDADPKKTRQQLAEHEVQVEDWGGKIPVAEISAKKKIGLTELLELILLVADMDKKNIMADPSREAVGTVIESHIDKGSGPVATVIIQTGTLAMNDLITVGGEVGGKVRIMRDHLGKAVEQAMPSQPVEIIGLKRAANVGDILTVIDKKELFKIKKQKNYKPTTPTVHIVKKEVEANNTQESKPKIKKYNILLKADTLGSLEAIIESLNKIKSDEVRVDIVAKGLGNFTEADVLRAAASQAKLMGFNVSPMARAQEVARGQELPFNTFTVIYDLIDQVIAGLEDFLDPEVIRTTTGELKVLEVFRTKLPRIIAGGKVKSGKILTGSSGIIIRNENELGSVKIEQVQVDKKTLNEAPTGHECGLKLKTNQTIEAGDTIQVYTEESKKKKLIIE
ncbi:translation initiation factor IF-2 [Patescibacteria group bacterium]|nr:translation initiation factor IF-2 [Patescibacteria group bacterium]MBU1890133.1 translation initiation factor IF-2 [Patescibacteria group bacterium]